MGIEITQKGSFRNIEAYLEGLQKADQFAILNKYGAIGVAALARATPRDDGDTANGWYYKIINRKGYHSIRWYNHHEENGANIAVLIQYGHATKNGGYVEGIDYINPAIKPIFEQIANEVWKEVTK